MMVDKTSTKELLEILARRIRTRRTELGLTQEQLAERAELSANYLSKLELGWKTPSVDTLVSLADALGVPVCDLLAAEPEDRWLALVHEIAYSLSKLSEPEAEFFLHQFRTTIDFLMKKHSC